MSRSSLFLNSSSYVIDTFVDPIPIGRTRGLNVPITFELVKPYPVRNFCWRHGMWQVLFISHRFSSSAASTLLSSSRASSILSLSFASTTKITAFVPWK